MQHFLSSQSENHGTFVLENRMKKFFLVMFSDQSLLMTSALLWSLASNNALKGFWKVFPRKAIFYSLAGTESSSFHFIYPEMRDSC